MRQRNWIAVILTLTCSGCLALDEKSCRQHLSSMGLAFEMPQGWSLRCNEQLGTIMVHSRDDVYATAPRILFAAMFIDADAPLGEVIAERLVLALGPAGSSARIETEAHPAGGERLRVNTRYERGSPMVRWGLFWRGTDALNEALYADAHWPEDAPDNVPATLQAILDSVTFRGHPPER